MDGENERVFCVEHSDVMRCLGRLEGGQDDMKNTLSEINTKLGGVQVGQNNARVSAAEEKVKSHLLYWVIGIAAGALIVALINFTFHIKESKYINAQPKGVQSETVK